MWVTGAKGLLLFCLFSFCFHLVGRRQARSPSPVFAAQSLLKKGSVWKAEASFNSSSASGLEAGPMGSSSRVAPCTT